MPRTNETSPNENPDEAIKGVIMRNSDKIIGGAIDELFQDHKLIGRNNATEEGCILEVLKYLFSTNERMRSDEEIIAVTRQIVREYISKKSVRPFKPDKKTMADAYGHEKSLGIVEDDD